MIELWKMCGFFWNELTIDVENGTILIDVLHKNVAANANTFLRSANKLFSFYYIT